MKVPVSAYRERRDEVCRRLAAARVPASRLRPGTAFGPEGEGSARVSLATEPAALYEGIERLIASCSGRRS